MSEGQNKQPLSVDIALKASLTVKGEIPQKSVGRVVDALTDIIRPFTEHRGLQGDRIRLQREEIAIDIARKTIERAKLEGVKLNPVPTKMLVPFLEKASLEDLQQEMQ